MIYLVLSVIASTLIFVIFKLFNRYQINTLQAIVINYLSATIYGLSTYQGNITIKNSIETKWFLGAFGLGFLFISIFNVMALTAQRNGLSVASVASKMSVIIPIIFGFSLYNESTSTIKIIGIILALAAVYFTSIKSKGVTHNSNWTLPVILFIGSGIIDTSIKYLETNYVSQNAVPIFTSSIFFVAFLIGILVLTYKSFKKGITITLKNIIGGLILGIVNYYSMYFLIKALKTETIESSSAFTINNVAIVTLTTILGLFLFREHLSKKNWLGIGLAIISIVMVSYS